MRIIAGHVRVPADSAHEYVSAHHDLIRRARNAPGCLDMAITTDPVEVGRVNNYERWESRDAIEAWRAVANAPGTGLEMRDVEVRAYEIAGERGPF